MDKYLLEILQDSNTIIIPGLGALTITNTDTGETMFMPYLQHDDGKLAEFVAEKDGLEIADARIMVGRYVREIQAVLAKGESYSMFQLGTFVKADDGDIEYEHWVNPEAATESTEELNLEGDALTNEEPIIEPEVEIEGEIEPEIEAEVEDLEEPIAEESEIELEIIESTPEPEIESIPEVIETPEVAEIPKEIIPEEILDPTPVAETKIVDEPIIEAESVVSTPDDDGMSKEEIEIKHAIEDALLSTSKPKESAPIIETREKIMPDVTLERAPVIEDFASTVQEDEESVAAVTTDGEEVTEKKEKEKAGAKFWIFLILAALLIIGGGAYIGRNYNELKQKIPFLADEVPEVKEKPILDEMDEIIKSQESRKSESRNNDDINELNTLENDDSKVKVEEDKTPVKPEPVVKPKPKPTPTTTITPSAGGHYHIIAGAFSSIDNANNLAKEFKAKGLGSSVIKNGELNAVSMQSYPTSEAAKADLSKMNAIQPGAWILYK